jgi:heme exporter protein B
MKGFLAFIKFSFIQEYRSWHQVIGIFIFSWLIAYVTYRIKASMDVTDFAVVFWVFVLLLAINITMRAEHHLSSGESLFVYTLSDPSQYLIARIAFNAIYLFISSLAFYAFLIMFFYPSIDFHIDMFWLICLTCLVISACLSFISALGTKTGKQNVLVSILSIPLLIPAVILLSQLSIQTLMGAGMDNSKIISIIGLSLLSISASILLYPYIWRE